MVEPGTHVGRYEVLAALGGAVYLGRDPLRDRPVAIRVLESSLNAARAPRSETSRDRGHADALASLRHSHIVPFIEAIEFGSRMCAVSEYVRGKSLHDLIATRADVSLADKLRWIDEVIKAVAAAHEHGIAHGHISPKTIVIDELNNAQLLGFDIELLHGFSRLSGFEAPEIFRGEPPVPASDVFSIGAVAHAILTSPRSLERGPLVVREPAPYQMTPIDDTVGVGHAVIETIRRALEIDPERRVSLKELDSHFAMAHWWHQRTAADGHKAAELGDYAPLGDLFSPPPPAPDPLDQPAASSEQVQFTVYRPKAVRPGEWRQMLAYVHLADPRPDAPPDAPTPLEQVQALADRALGSDRERFRGTTADATQDVPREGEITIIPTVAGVEFNPERRTFKWVQDVQEERFFLRAGPALHGRTARGRVSAYLGVLLIAEVELAIRVDAALTETATAPVEAVRARTFRNIFASYSHADTEIVRQFEAYAATLGDRYLRDVRDLRAGQAWQPALLRLIDRADVFQLFWSSTAMRSRHVRTEWEYALSLKRQDFVRPTYWEEPLPSAPEEGLPPEALSAIEFQRISLGAAKNVASLPGDPYAPGDDTAVSPPRPSIVPGRIPRHVDVDAEAQRHMRLAEIEGILARAHRLYDEGHFRLALTACDEALTLDGTHWDATMLHRKVVVAIAREEHEPARQPASSAPPPVLSPRRTDGDTGSIARRDILLPSKSEAPLERTSTFRWVAIALVVIALVLALLLVT